MRKKDIVFSGMMGAILLSLGTADAVAADGAVSIASTKYVENRLSAKQDALTAGSDISIADGVIGVLTADSVVADSTAPVQSGAVAAALAGKADASTTYTKTQVDELIDGVDTSEAVLEFGELKTTIGDTTALTTANKDSIVGAINSLQSTKADASALTDYAKTSDLGALATKDTVSVDQIAAGAIGTAQLSESVVVSLSKADTALQESALTSYAKSADVTTEIAEATSGLLSKSLADSVYAPIGDYATTGYVDTTETDAVNAAKAYTDEKTTGMLTETAANELYATAEQGTTADRVAGLVDSETTGLDATYNLAVAAIPRPGADCTTSKTCVLSVNANGAPYWIELTDDSTN